jgi:hypothetical protein
LLILKKYLPVDVDFGNADIHFSPNSQQAIFDFATPTTTYSYLFNIGEETTEPFDISPTRDSLLQAWNIEKNKEITKILETFPKAMRPLALSEFEIIDFSPDQTKVLYQARSNFTLPLAITPPVIGANQTPEARSLQAGKLYVYDKKEDKNYLIPWNEKDVESTPTKYKVSPGTVDVQHVFATPTSVPNVFSLTPTPPFVPLYSEKEFPIIWHSDSKHLSIQKNKQIVMIDYDGENERTIYSGPFEKDFFFITNSGKLYVLSNLNPQNNQYDDLYEIGIQ